MIITTADVVPGQAVQILGLVRGNIVTSKNIGRDIMASAKTLVGGEIKVRHNDDQRGAPNRRRPA